MCVGLGRQPARLGPRRVSPFSLSVVSLSFSYIMLHKIIETSPDALYWANDCDVNPLCLNSSPCRLSDAELQKYHGEILWILRKRIYQLPGLDIRFSTASPAFGTYVCYPSAICCRCCDKNALHAKGGVETDVKMFAHPNPVKMNLPFYSFFRKEGSKSSKSVWSCGRKVS